MDMFSRDEAHMSHIIIKPVFGLGLGKTQTGLLSYMYRDKLESFKILTDYGDFKLSFANIKGADQTVRMFRLICIFVVRIWLKTCFLMTWLIFFKKLTYRNDPKFSDR